MDSQPEGDKKKRTLITPMIVFASHAELDRRRTEKLYWLGGVRLEIVYCSNNISRLKAELFRLLFLFPKVQRRSNDFLNYTYGRTKLGRIICFLLLLFHLIPS